MIVGAIVIGGVIGSFAIRSRGQAKFIEKHARLRHQNEEVAALLAQQQKLSNLIGQTRSLPRPQVNNHEAEMAKLRSEAEALRGETGQPGTRSVTAPQSEAAHAISHFDAMTHSAGSFSVVAEDTSKKYATELYKRAAGERNRFSGDARNLTHAVRMYAAKNNGQMPASFDQATAYAHRGELPLAGSYQDRDPMAGVDDFEIVYQGSLNDLTNIPQQKVALIRQRQPWPTPNGKWGRIYTMASGRVYVVESDDNFQAWEAAHIIPPPAAR